MLLSRVAENVYWAGRYLERAEATARLVRVHTELFLDLPLAAGVGWDPLLAVTAAAAPEGAGPLTEEEVVGWLAVDQANPGSVVASLAAARANFRVLRAVFPMASQEKLNHLYLRSVSTRSMAVERRTRMAWMDEVVDGCQLLSGVLAGVMSHNSAYAFLQIGRFVERADMTTRVLDTQAVSLAGLDATAEGSYADVRWMNVLRSVSAHQMFRSSMGVGMSAEAVVRFLLTDAQFPRSVEFCLTQIGRSLLELPRYDSPMSVCAEVQESLEDAKVGDLAVGDVHDYLDELQLAIGHLHGALDVTYFQAAESAAGVLAVA